MEVPGKHHWRYILGISFGFFFMLMMCDIDWLIPYHGLTAIFAALPISRTRNELRSQMNSFSKVKIPTDRIERNNLESWVYAERVTLFNADCCCKTGTEERDSIIALSRGSACVPGTDERDSTMDSAGLSGIS